MSEQNALKVFSFEGRETRIVMVDGEPWWVAKDVCDVLELTNPTEALRILEDDERNTLRISEGIRGNPEMNIISESGLYTLIMRSNKPEAKRFRKWVTSDVLPSIRRHGAYMTDQKAEDILSDPDNIIRFAQQWKAEREKRLKLEAEAKTNEPLVLFAKSLQVSEDSILVGNLAKILKQNGIEMGQTRLYKWLREHGYLMKQQGDNWNRPTQRAMELGLFEVLTRSIVNNSDGLPKAVYTTKVTGKGQMYFVNHFLKKQQQEKRAEEEDKKTKAV